MPTSVELRRERAKTIGDMRAIVDKAEAEGRNLDGQEQEQWVRMEECVKDMAARIERQEYLERQPAETELRSPVAGGRVETAGLGAADADGKQYREAFWQYVRFGSDGVHPDLRYALYRGYGTMSEPRAMSTVLDAAGGYAIPDTFSKSIETALKAYGGVRESGATIWRTESGEDLILPVSDDTGNTGAILNENTSVATGDLTVGQRILRSYVYSSNLVLVPNQLLADAGFPLEPWIAEQLGIRIGRITNTHFTTGAGANQPYGVVTQSVLGRTAAAGYTTDIDWTDLVQLYTSVDPAYSRNGRWMFSNNTLGKLMMLRDGDGRPVWAAGLVGGAPDRVLGFPYTINQDMATMAASAKPILYGDFSKYHIRDVGGYRFLRLNERYAEVNQTAFLAFSRHDGILVNAGQDPIKHLINAAS